MIRRPFCAGLVPLRFALLLLVPTLSGCFRIPLDPAYQGPPERPPALDRYYPHTATYSSFTDELKGEKERFTIRRITLQGDFTPIVIDYYRRPEPSDTLVFVFPVLGGKNIISEYFARYFARQGFDTAIINRNDSFKKPENFDRLEEIFRQDVLRDRLAMDFFEKHYGKRRFGSFGISRGGINVAITAGVDPRLKYNVIALGGTDMVSLFRTSNQRRIAKYRNSVMEQKGIDEAEFYRLLAERLKTDPKQLAHYIDGRNTLLFLALYDGTVPFEYGEKLREQLGNPETIYLVADHYVALLYTQFLKFLPPTREFSLLPVDYVETEALAFYHRSFKTGESCVKPLWMRVLQVPATIIGRLVSFVF